MPDTGTRKITELFGGVGYLGCVGWRGWGFPGYHDLWRGT